MGYGVPAAVAAKLRAPGRVVICLAGDGDFMMTGQELATAMQYGAAPLFIVIDNGMLGTIRMHQERHYPGRVSATDLVNPDFAALARAYGAHAEYVETTAEFVPAVQRSLAAGRAALIHVRTDPEALTIGQSLSEIRSAARKAGSA
jgi:acetolactate synthase-1/2/3 large subunit